MNNKLNGVIVLSTAIILSACGGSSSDTSFSGFDTFDGTWGTGCVYDPDFMDADIYTVTINGDNASVALENHAASDCSGTASRTASVPLQLSYEGSIALSDCFNGQNVNAGILYPITVDGVQFSESQAAALGFTQDDTLAAFGLLCTNNDGTILYGGDSDSGDGTSEATRPTSTDLSEGLTKQ